MLGALSAVCARRTAVAGARARTATLEPLTSVVTAPSACCSVEKTPRSSRRCATSVRIAAASGVPVAAVTVSESVAPSDASPSGGATAVTKDASAAPKSVVATACGEAVAAARVVVEAPPPRRGTRRRTRSRRR